MELKRQLLVCYCFRQDYKNLGY